MSGTISPQVERNRREDGTLKIGYLRAGFEVAIARLKRGRPSWCWRSIEDELQPKLCAFQTLLTLLLFLPFLMARATSPIHVTAVAAFSSAFNQWPSVYPDWIRWERINPSAIRCRSGLRRPRHYPASLSSDEGFTNQASRQCSYPVM